MPTAVDVPEIDLASLDWTQRVAEIDAIRQVNPHRHELELLTAITHLDTTRKLIAGFKDTTANDFWVRGHMPGFALLPGVLMCEAAAQLCAYYGTSQGISQGRLMGLGGIEMAKFRTMVRPGDRLLLIGQGLKVDRRLLRFHVRGYVDTQQAFETIVLGVPLKTEG
jgi:3-hydroxyacyl-[acyl-carrier-protein] dehydratase